MDEVIDRMQTYQKKQKKNPEVRQIDTLPDSFDDFTYDDKMWMESYLCKHTKMYYKEEEYFDYVAQDMENYWLNRYWRFDCQMQLWANNRIRLNFLMGVGGRRSIGKLVDSRVHQKTTPPDIEAILSNPDLPDVETVTFARSSTAINQINIVFDEDEFDGLKSQYALYQTNQGPEAFSNYNFSTPKLWDDIWFDENSTYLAKSEEFILGKTSIETARIPISPEKITKKRYTPNAFILGIPYHFVDYVKENMDLFKVQESNIDNRIPLANKYNSTTQTILFRFDFTERHFTFAYFNNLDILASIGGLNAFITPLVSKLVPFFVIAFLFRLAKIIKDYASRAYRDELVSTLELSANLIQKRDHYDDAKDNLV